MTDLDTTIADTLHRRSVDARVDAGFADAALARGRALRRRRRTTAVSGVAAVAVAGALAVTVGLPGSVDSRPLPPATSTSPRLESPNPTPGPTAPTPALVGLEIPYAIGNVISADFGTYELPGAGAPVDALVRVRGGLLVEAGRQLSFLPDGGGEAQPLAAGATGAVADTSGRWVAWLAWAPKKPGTAVTSNRASSVTLYDLATRRTVGALTVTTRPIIHAVTRDVVTFSPATDPGGTPIRWDIASGRQTPVVPGAGTTPVAVAVRPDGRQAVLFEWDAGRENRVNCVLGGPTSPWTVSWRRCDLSPAQAAYSPNGARLAVFDVTSGSLEVLDAATGKPVAAFNTGAGEVAWASDRVLFHSGDGGVQRCDVAAERCAKVLDDPRPRVLAR
jgi:hypothetical protein